MESKTPGVKLPGIFKTKIPEWSVFALFVVLYCVVSAYHEPWYDEALSWQIAKCASLKDLLITLPPYEGHPPFWHLILAIPAKLGVPYEIGLKSVGFLFSVSAVAVLVFRCRMPRILRLTLPFSYFVFYQYGVISRPYSVMMLALLLLGVSLEKRKEHPWRVFVCLLILCFSNAYGILMAGGVSAGILWEIWREKGTVKLFCGLFKDGRTLSLLVLLVAVMILAVEFMPAKDGYSVNIQGDNSLVLCLVCTLFTIPANVTFLSSSWFGVEQLSISSMSMPAAEFISCIFIGLILWFILICASSKKSLKFFVLPYLLFSSFAAMVYFSTHHIGLAFLLLVFYIEVLSRDENRFEIGRAIGKRLIKTPRDKKLIRAVFLATATVCFAVPLYWSVTAAVNEIKSNYYFARDAAGFIREYSLDEKLILGPWNNGMIDVDDYNEGNEDYFNCYMIDDAVPITAYFDRNIFFNLNGGDDSMAYVLHRIASYPECRQAAAGWSAAGKPDVIVGHPKLGYVYDGLTYDDYTMVKLIEFGFVWKDQRHPAYMPVYLKNALADELGLGPQDNGGLIDFDGFRITPEMLEQYENGVPLEEILKPYLDAMFGEE
ncbi:MAG: hypothetical protein IJV00_00480 [Clostridia bacterium]|nr:hypothetical protein [Clostridia bacterium]